MLAIAISSLCMSLFQGLDIPCSSPPLLHTELVSEAGNGVVCLLVVPLLLAVPHSVGLPVAPPPPPCTDKVVGEGCFGLTSGSHWGFPTSRDDARPRVGFDGVRRSPNNAISLSDARLGTTRTPHTMGLFSRPALARAASSLLEYRTRADSLNRLKAHDRTWPYSQHTSRMEDSSIYKYKSISTLYKTM